jgi:hypothetical protein
MADVVKVIEDVNNVIVRAQGAQGLRGKSILNGPVNPTALYGTEGEFFLNTTTNVLYGPKLSDSTWVGANEIHIATSENLGLRHSWEMAQIVGPVDGSYKLEIDHNLGFFPNVTVKNSAGDVLETGIDYNSINKITLIMAQPFSGTAYLS